MLHLRTFGGLAVLVDSASPSGAATQRKPLALLALLATAGERGMSRDKLVAYLWPESDTESGRRLLRQICYALRRDLGAPELFLGSTELHLNQAVMCSDVESFERALAQNDSADAVSLYTAPFLDGFYLNGEGEFERWVERERARLANRCRAALAALAAEATGRGEHGLAVNWWRRLTELDPLSTHAAVGLMTTLHHAGERAEAIRHGQAHVAFVRQQLDAEPPSQVSALIRRLQTQTEDPEGLSRAPARPVSEAASMATTAAAPVVPRPLLQQLRRADVLSRISLTAVAVLVTGVGAYALWASHQTSRVADIPFGRKMLAVLPFENLGTPADEYFADGITEAITTRLGSVRSLGIIAWQSSSQYKGMNKSPHEIGEELGVQYILEGSVRWEKGSRASRVRVSPTLIRVSDGAQVWAAQYDTTLTGLFAVQSNLATRVAGALDIAVADAERLVLEARPTANLQAYDLYLRARELVDREFDLGNVRTANRLYERAVVLDSTFALAYAWLSVNYVWMHDTYMDRSAEQLARAKMLLDRALRLDPDLPESHGALGFYYYHVLGDYNRALTEFSRARRSRPSDPYLAGLMAEIYGREGRWDRALAYTREAALIDPRNVLGALGTGSFYSTLRQFTTASYYYDKALALRPQSVDAQLGKALAYLSQTGDLAGAQHFLPDLSREVPNGVAINILGLFEVATLLDAERQARLFKLTPAALGDGDSASLAVAKGMAYRARGRTALARVQFDSARIVLEAKVQQEPGDDYRHALLGLALAGLGRSAEAVREGERAVDLTPISKDAEGGALLIANLARIYVLLDESEKAIDQLEIVLTRPGPLSANWLRADPFWDSLRGSARFQRLAGASN